MFLTSAAPAPHLAALSAAGEAGVWLPAIAALFILLLAGLSLINTGLGRGKNAAHSMSMALLAHGVALIAFFAVGYAFMCGGIGARHAAAVVGHAGRQQELHNLVTMARIGWGYLGASGFFLARTARTESSAAWFVLMALYLSVSVLIPIGACLERCRLRSIAGMALAFGALIFPLYGCWTWGGGWLAQLGPRGHLGHGIIDAAGSSVVHLLGAGVALAATLCLGPRLGKYDERRRPRPIFGHHMPMVIAGSLMVYAAYFGFNVARLLMDPDPPVARICLNTLLCGSTGSLLSALVIWRLYRRPDPSLLCNGLLAGLVASSAGCTLIAPWAALLTGGLAGLLATGGVLLLERRGVDDPVGAISVHGLCGAWGMIAVALFADGTAGDHYNGVGGAVTGLFYGGGARQLLVQIIAVIVCAIWSVGGGFLVFALLQRLLGPNRVRFEVEQAGLDIPELGAPAYPEFITVQAPADT